MKAPTPLKTPGPFGWQAKAPAPQSSIAATKTGPTGASAADQRVRPTNRRRLRRFSGLVVHAETDPLPSTSRDRTLPVNRNRHSARKTEIVADKGASGSSRLQIIEAALSTERPRRKLPTSGKSPC